MVARTTVFGHLDVTYDHRVLEPRPWTMAQSRWAAELLGERGSPSRVLELCAGVGHIGLLALALAGAPVTPHRLVTVDVNPVACDHARKNAAAAGLAACVDIREGRIDSGLAADECFEVVIADPPWVARSETARFPDDPLIAIDGGLDGLDLAWQCLQAAATHLAPGGSMVLQIGPGQADQVARRLPHVAPGLALAETRTFGRRGTLVRLTTV